MKVKFTTIGIIPIKNLSYLFNYYFLIHQLLGKVIDGFFIYMKQLRNILFILSLIILIYGLGFISGLKYQRMKNDESMKDVEIKVDTIRITDTIEKPVTHYIRTLRIDTLATPKDTLYLPIEQKEYIHQINNDSIDGSIKAVFSGYNPSLDLLQYELSFKNKTLLKRRKWGFNINAGVGGGWNLHTKKIEPMIGITIGFGYRL